MLLVLLWCLLTGYTLIVGVEHGWNLLPQFFGDLAALAWPGQFNLDFTCFLALSATWVAWRHRFSSAGLALALVAFFGGFMFLAPYLLVIARGARSPEALLRRPELPG
jgi:hypothetical protein